MENKERLGSSGIGGQAVIEGIMMRNKDNFGKSVDCGRNDRCRYSGMWGHS